MTSDFFAAMTLRISDHYVSQKEADRFFTSNE